MRTAGGPATPPPSRTPLENFWARSSLRGPTRVTNLFSPVTPGRPGHKPEATTHSTAPTPTECSTWPILPPLPVLPPTSPQAVVLHVPESWCTRFPVLRLPRRSTLGR